MSMNGGANNIMPKENNNKIFINKTLIQFIIFIQLFYVFFCDDLFILDNFQ